MMPVRIFIHGLESSNQGTKSVFFREKYPDMIIPHFTGELQERMENLKEILSDKSDIMLVGSSFGGLMASIFAMENESKVKKMILLAPAINLIRFAYQDSKIISVPVWIYHGTDDNVIPLAEVEPIAKKTFNNLSFNVAEDDHFLHKTFTTIDWDSLLA
jgi:alpha-beta hydrolase superfamily lysophospholipase